MHTSVFFIFYGTCNRSQHRPFVTHGIYLRCLAPPAEAVRVRATRYIYVASLLLVLSFVYTFIFAWLSISLTLPLTTMTILYYLYNMYFFYCCDD